MPGDLALVLGEITLKLEGTLTILKDHSWKLRGTLKSFDDKYNFDMKKVTSFHMLARNVATVIGRLKAGEGIAYWIAIRGSKPYDDDGNCCESRRWWKRW